MPPLFRHKKSQVTSLATRLLHIYQLPVFTTGILAPCFPPITCLDYLGHFDDSTLFDLCQYPLRTFFLFFRDYQGKNTIERLKDWKIKRICNLQSSNLAIFLFQPSLPHAFNFFKRGAQVFPQSKLLTSNCPQLCYGHLKTPAYVSQSFLICAAHRDHNS